jgi:hypothetical protein
MSAFFPRCGRCGSQAHAGFLLRLIIAVAIVAPSPVSAIHVHRPWLPDSPGDSVINVRKKLSKTPHPKAKQQQNPSHGKSTGPVPSTRERKQEPFDMEEKQVPSHQGEREDIRSTQSKESTDRAPDPDQRPSETQGAENTHATVRATRHNTTATAQDLFVALLIVIIGLVGAAGVLFVFGRYRRRAAVNKSSIILT